MSRSSFIEINGHKIELFLSTWGMSRICEMIGGELSELSVWLGECSSVERVERFSKILAILANGAIMQKNTDIEYGFEQGEKRPLFKEDFFIYAANAADIAKYQEEIFTAISMGLNYTVPEGVEVEAKDPDLAELEREKNQ